MIETVVVDKPLNAFYIQTYNFKYNIIIEKNLHLTFQFFFSCC